MGGLARAAHRLDDRAHSHPARSSDLRSAVQSLQRPAVRSRNAASRTLFVPFRLYEGFWRYTSIWDLRNMVIGVATSTAIFYLIVHHAFGLTAYSRSIFIIDSTLLICLMGGVRVAQRVCREFRRPAGARRVLIYGAGDAGEMIVREMIHARELAYEPVGFVDDNPAKSGQHIHGVPVLGTRADLPHIVAEKQP